MKIGFWIALSVGVGLATVSLAYEKDSTGKKTTYAGVAWNDEFEVAKQEAARTGKPILLLSMFGRLNDDMCCANARTMKATVFNSPEFKKLSEEVVVAWEMVREVPKVYIDLGDGKQVVRTVRGNAVSYLCNSDGTVFDAFPGVYEKSAYLDEIRKSISNNFGKPWATVKANHDKAKKFPRPTLMTLGKSVAESPTLRFVGAPNIEGAMPRASATDTPARRAFIKAAQGVEDLSLRAMAMPDVVSMLVGKDGTQDVKVAAIIKADSETNLKIVRPALSYYFVSLENFPTPTEARDAVLMDLLKIPYKDPYFGLKDLLMPGTK